MKIHVSRNFFGDQLSSFEQQLPAHEQLRQFGEAPTYRAIFIRAPAVLEADTEVVTVLSEYTLTESERARMGREKVIVAAQSGHMLVTAFHPELTDDTRWCAAASPVRGLSCARWLFACLSSGDLTSRRSNSRGMAIPQKAMKLWGPLHRTYACCMLLMQAPAISEHDREA
jgi:SNO glutamine amidotransferase family